MTQEKWLFNLVKYFSLTSSIAFVVLLGVISFTLRANQIDKMIATTEYQNMVLAQSFANSMWDRFSTYVESASTLTGDQLRARPETAQIDQVVRKLTFDLPVLKVKIYSISGRTVYSSEQAQMGVDKSNNIGFLASAREGKPKSKLTYRDKFPAFSGEASNVNVVESYLPIRAFDGSIEGVFEIYFDATKSVNTINREIVESVLFLVVGFGLLYIALYLIINRADGVIRGQYGELQSEIKERKIIQEQLISAKRRAEVANRVKSEFLANMSHELRTPLNAVIGFSETLVDEIFGKLANEKQKEYLTDIHSSGQHLLELINDILDVSAIEAGKIEIHEAVVNVKRVADDAILLLKTRAEKGGVELKNMINGKDLKLRADERRVIQILVNLLSNAVKFSHYKGEVKIEGRRLENGAFVFEIVDNGIGMDDAGMAAAMEKFGQAHSSLEIDAEGTGLGLPLTKGLVEAHGGTLSLESEPGVGTTVKIEFPKERVIP